MLGSVRLIEVSSLCNVFVCFFFFKQKTAYEMRISDWSSDVCSSDLEVAARAIEQDVVRYADCLVGAVARQASHRFARNLAGKLLEIGRASCRERVCQYV